MRGLAVSSAERVSALPEVPTLKEIGFPGVVATNWFALAAPAGLDPGIVARLGAAAREALADPGIRERLEAAGVVPMGAETPAEIAGFVAKERERWAPVARAAGIKPA
jgi:tripartite-type tricarboxylate transporter receptor subunit TctC